jgi:hypothetical protein
MIEIKAILQRLEPAISRLTVDVERQSAELHRQGAELERQGAELHRHGEELHTLGQFIRLQGESLAELKGRVSQLPTTMAIFTYMTGLVALSATLFGMGLAVLKYLGQ